MRLNSPDPAETVSRLEAALARPGIPTRAAERCLLLIDRLRRPVRLGVFGLPGSGKEGLINALLRQEVIPSGLALPTMEVAHGPSPRMKITTAEGHVFVREGMPDAKTLREDPIFIRLELPLDALRSMTVLNLVTSARPKEISAALRWAAKRSDIALWCAQDWAAAERDIWAGAPAALKNHAVLVRPLEPDEITGPRTVVGSDRTGGFERVFPMDTFNPERKVIASHRGAALGALAAHLEQVIEAGRAEDMDAALMLLHRVDRQNQPRRPRTRRHEVSEMAQPNPPDLPQADMAEDEPAAQNEVQADLPLDVAPEAKEALTRAFNLMRRTASELLDGMPTGPEDEDTATHVLERIEATFDTLMDMFENDDVLYDTWPALSNTILAGQEMSLLLRLEGGVDQATEAAALLLQVRRETEVELAA